MKNVRVSSGYFNRLEVIKCSVDRKTDERMDAVSVEFCDYSHRPFDLLLSAAPELRLKTEDNKAPSDTLGHLRNLSE